MTCDSVSHMSNLTANVVSTYRAASGYAFLSGLSWYDDAHDFAMSLDPANVSRASGIIAALSPLSPWANNVRKSRLFYSLDGKPVWNGSANGIGLGNSVRAAERIYNGADPLDVLNGRKVRSFYLSILDPMSNDAEPVIDRHAFDIANGFRGDNKSRSILSRKAVYDTYASAYVDAAGIVGVTPKQVQAITWVAHRENLGIEWAG